jgi:hypothetical protein
MGGVVGGALSLGSALIGGSSASDAAQIQADAANQANAQQLQIFNTQNAQLAPQRAAGYNALNQIGALLPGQSNTYDAQGNLIGPQTGSGYLTKQFTNQDLNANLAPNYAFQLGQGQQALNNQLNATGGLVGGNSLKAMQDYSQNFAGNAYQQAFSNFNTQRGNIYNTLASIAGIGQSAQNQSNTLATNYGTNAANLTTGAAAAQAAGLVGQANAYSGGINNIANQFQLSNLLGGGGGGFGTGYGSLPNIGGIGGSITNYLSGGPSFNSAPIDTGFLA